MNKLISVFKYNCIYILANSVGSNVYLYRYIEFHYWVFAALCFAPHFPNGSEKRGY